MEVVSETRPVLYRNHGIATGAVDVGVIPPDPRLPHHLLVTNPHVNALSLRTADGSVLMQTGDSLPFSHRPFMHRQFVFPLTGFDSTEVLSLRLSKSGENLSYGILLLDDAGLDRYLSRDRMITGFLIGFYSLAILLSMALLLNNPTRKYLFFWLYVFFSLAWILNDAGLLYQWLWPERPDWHRNSRAFFSSLTMVLFVLYLGRTDNALLSRGVRVTTYILFGFLGLKVTLMLFSLAGLFPEGMKSAVMHFNAVMLALLMGSVLLSLLFYLIRSRRDLYEVFAIGVYCLFVVFLSLKELGVDVIGSEAIHRFDAMLFFPFQCLFMAVQLYKRERRREREAEKDLAEFRISQQREADRRVREVEETERKRIAQNIHDEIGSIFAAMRYQLLSIREKWKAPEVREDLERLGRLSEQGIQRQYSIIDDLLFEIRSGMGLRESIAKQLDLVIREDIEASYAFEAEEDRLSDFQKTQVFRIVSELLTNTIRHARAHRVSLSVLGGETMRIEYSDDGRGFDTKSDGKGRGLQGVRARAQALGGTIELSSGSQGTRCIISIPL